VKGAQLSETPHKGQDLDSELLWNTTFQSEGLYDQIDISVVVIAGSNQHRVRCYLHDAYGRYD
jgi:hypothetical protein